MANCSSSKKALRQNEKRRLINKMRISRIRTLIKSALNAIQNATQDVSYKALKKTQSEIMKGVIKGVLKLNNASRKVSNLVHKFKQKYPEA